MIRHPAAPFAAALLGLATGVAIGNAAAGRAVVSAIPAVAELAPALPEVVIPEFSHAGMALASRQAQRHLEEGRPWAAWQEVRRYVETPDDAPDAFVLLAARAAAGWEGWSQVRRLLHDREGAVEFGAGEALYLLGRAHQARSEWDDAAAAYQRHLAVRGAGRVEEVAARLGETHTRAGRHAAAATAYARAAQAEGGAADWMHALEAQARARAKGPPLAGTAAAASASAPVRVRQARAEAAGWEVRGDVERALRWLGGERAQLDAEAAPWAAELALEEARILAAAGRQAEARVLLHRVAGDARVPGAARMRAAGRLGELPGTRTADEELARAAAYEAGRRPGLAARSLRAALRAGAPDGPAERLRLGRLLFDERDFRPARAALQEAAERQTDRELRAEAELLAARALVRLGRPEGMAELRKVPERHPGTAAAGTALFLLGDAATDRAAAIALYRRAAEIPASPDAREALFRVGDRRLKAGDVAGALAAWESYAASYPTGDATAEIAYRAGVLHERAGRAAKAAALFRAAIAAEPVSYYAVRAADRAGVDPLAPSLAGTRGWPGIPGDAAEAAAALGGLDALRDAGLTEPWKEELEWQTHRLDQRPSALLALAEGLAARGHAVEAIRLGRELLRRRGGEWDERLLRVVFPFPYREVLEAEARRAGVDAYLLAALVRQESSFDPRARSRVGATGLSQIMPATGAWLAGSAGATPFHPSLLEVPEVNLRMGAGYLRDQLRRYDGKRDLALAAYNAGPGRADRWRRELGYGGDPDRFREAIPFAETRHYVKVVLRNAVVYRRLYADGWSPGLTGGS